MRDLPDDFWVVGRRVECREHEAISWMSGTVASVDWTDDANRRVVVRLTSGWLWQFTGSTRIEENIRAVAPPPKSAPPAPDMWSQLRDDLTIYGNAVARRRDDGTVERVDPTTVILDAVDRDGLENRAPSIQSREASRRRDWGDSILPLIARALRDTSEVEASAAEISHAAKPAPVPVEAVQRVGHLATALLTVPGVTLAVVDDLGDSRVAVLVEGGDDAAIAQCLMDETTPGVELVGEQELRVGDWTARWGRWVDGVPLRRLLAWDETISQDDFEFLKVQSFDENFGRRDFFSQAQLDAISAHHSERLRRLVIAGDAAALARAPRVCRPVCVVGDDPAWESNLADER